MSAAVLFTCPVDGQSCEVADEVSRRCLRPGSRAIARVREAFNHVVEHLPCDRCREAEQMVSCLRRTRFGKHERNILLYSPGPQAPSGAILDPELSSHSDRETYLRAVRKLSKLNLLDTDRRFVRVDTAGTRKDGTPVSRAYAHRTLRQTEFGAVVVELYRSEMESGRAIRWDRHIGTILERVRKPTGELLSLFADVVEVQLAAMGEMAQGTGPQAREARRMRYLVQPIHDALRLSTDK